MPASNVQTRSDRGATRWAAGAPMGTCDYTDGPCQAAELAEALGPNIFETFLRFVAAANPGDGLSLQRNRDGLTIQVTRSLGKYPSENGRGAGAEPARTT